MPATLTPTLLAKPAPHSARVIATELLSDLERRLVVFDADESASIHDLRVGLRRLRTWIRAYRPELDDTVSKKSRRALRKLAHATNAARDAEAMLEWIAAQSAPAVRERAGVRYLTDRLERERAEAAGAARERLRHKMPKLIATLGKELRSYWLRCDIDEPSPVATMARVTRDALVTQCERFTRAIDRIESSDDAARIHRARISAKRLRYLLDAIDGDAAASLAQRLASAQDMLGTSHDMHVVANRVVRELGEIGARDARVAAIRAINPDADQARGRLARLRPGLNALATRAHQADRDAYSAFRATWTGDDAARVTTAIAAIGDELVVRAS